jgi:Xaa-Pro aminopeptidase
MSARLDETFVASAAAELRRAGIDAWLLYDLEARNRVAAELVNLPQGQTRRWFVLLRPDHPPHALAHRIELGEWENWNHELDAYVGWEELEREICRLVAGCRTVAMEVSPRDAVPFMDNVPAGVVELVASCDVEVVSSADLISGTYAQWGERGRDLHREASEILARTARAAFELAGRAVGLADADGGAETGESDAVDVSTGVEGACGKVELPMTEYDLAEWIVRRLEDEGLTEGETIVAIGPNSAKPHYWPQAESTAALVPDQVLLIDLWGRMAGDPAAVFADQTWMGFLGSELPADVAEVWEAVREARDAGVAFIRASSGALPTGADVDRQVRSVLEGKGFGEAIFHRTGHGMDRVNHGFGPNLDCVETRDERPLVPGVGFSVEPGLYFDGRFGVRSEINVHMGTDGPEVTPPDHQAKPWLLG